MGAFADSLFTLLLGWVRGLVSAIMTLFSSGCENGLIPFLGKNWLSIVLTILVIGLVGDWFIWMLRWQPYRVWGTQMRRIARALHLRARDEDESEDADEPEAMDEPEEAIEEDAQSPYAPPVYAQQDDMSGTRLYQRPTQQPVAQENIDFAQEDELELPPLTQEDEEEAYTAAQQEQDAQEYPGMYYDQSVYMRPVQDDAVEFEETSSEERILDDAQADADVFGNPDFADGQNDVEWAQEIDPLASYDDPRVLERLTQMTEDVQMPAEEPPVSDAQPRRRRRRRSETE